MVRLTGSTATPAALRQPELPVSGRHHAEVDDRNCCGEALTLMDSAVLEGDASMVISFCVSGCCEANPELLSSGFQFVRTSDAPITIGFPMVMDGYD